jgi:uncharacterized protein DUF4296
MRKMRVYYKFLPLLFFVCILYSCIPEQEQVIPSEIIRPDTMAELMANIHIAESTIMLNRINDRQTERNAVYIRSVLDDNGIDTSRFRNSFDYYTLHPALFSEIYDKVIEKLNEKKALQNSPSSPDSLVE